MCSADYLARVRLLSVIKVDLHDDYNFFIFRQILLRNFAHFTCMQNFKSIG